MKYSAINIGPIIKTLSMARQPRELWAASFMFSRLMQCIYNAVEGTGAVIISPAKPEKDVAEVGIYPDRIYFRGDGDIRAIIQSALENFYAFYYGKGKNPELSYFNIMVAYSEVETESCAIAYLNQKLDVMELSNFPNDDRTLQTIYEIISNKGDYPFAANTEMIAKAQLEAHPEKKMKSHHRYYCIVQADGDNIGTTVSHPGLADGKVMEMSKALVHFGEKAVRLIKEFGGVPVYAGGDDLLFLAPVIGRNGEHIFSLLSSIEDEAFLEVREQVDPLGLKNDEGKAIRASLSYGIQISYYKYPLYEALNEARDLLFDTAKKKITDKKAVAWTLRKHSGGEFNAAFSRRNETLWSQFINLIDATSDNDVVSAVAHKIRQEEALVIQVLETRAPDRLDALFDKILEMDYTRDRYFLAVKELMPTLFECVAQESYISTLFSLLRTAKFIKGEDLKDE